MKNYNYAVDLYCGEDSLGSFHFKTLEGCLPFIEKDKLCDKAIISDNKGKAKFTVIINHED